VITGLHALIYSDDADATRAFLRDVLQWPSVEDAGSGDGWLIFRSGASEVGVHPTATVWEGREHRSERHHELALMCDDVQATRAELAARGATFVDEVADRGFGLACQLEVPGADPILLYEPRHATAFDLPG
jgi:catechol 2,3-dioxygenase-like lactoylglutathione lyase family enzyme